MSTKRKWPILLIKDKQSIIIIILWLEKGTNEQLSKDCQQAVEWSPISTKTRMKSWRFIKTHWYSYFWLFGPFAQSPRVQILKVWCYSAFLHTKFSALFSHSTWCLTNETQKFKFSDLTTKACKSYVHKRLSQ